MPEAMNSIRLYREEDQAPLLRLLRDSFGADYTQELWEWKYRRSPAGALPPAVMESDGDIVGHFGLVALPFDVRGEPRLAVLPSDVAVSPALRESSLGQGGAMREMRALAIDTAAGVADFGFAIPIPKFYSVARRLFREPPLRAVAELERVVSLRPALRRRRLPAPLAALIAKALDPLALPRLGSTPGGVRELAREDLDRLADPFAAAQARQRPVTLRKDAAYMGWRYLDHPAGDCRILGLEASGALAGYLAYRLRDFDGLRFCHVLDFECAPEEIEFAGRLLAALGRRCRRAGVSVLELWCSPEHPLRPTLDRAGFREREKAVRTLFLPLPKLGDDLALVGDGDRWLIAMGDSDGR